MRRLSRNRTGLCVLVTVLLLGFSISAFVVYLLHQRRLNQNLIRAVRHNDLAVVTLSLDRGADPNTGDYGQNRQSSVSVLFDTIRQLAGIPTRISRAPNVLLIGLNAWWKPEGGTDEPPQNTAIVKLLIKRGANVNCRDRSGDTPLIEAALSDRVEIVRMLLARGAEVNAKDDWGYTAYDYASDYHQADVCRVLQQAGGHD